MMNYILKLDPVWLQLPNPSPGPSASLFLLGGDGHQVEVPAPFLLAASPLVKNILTYHLPPAYSPCCFSIPAATGDVLHLVRDILTSGIAAGDHGTRLEDVKQALKSLGVKASIVFGSPGKKSTDPFIDRKMGVEDLTCVSEESAQEKKVKLEIIVKLEEKYTSELDHDDNADGVQGLTSVPGSKSCLCSRKTAPVDNKMKIPCTLCSREFTVYGLKKHHTSVHSKKTIMCTLCPYMCAFKSDLKRHVGSVHKQFEVQCKLCSKKFNRKDSLNKHINALHNVSCSLCSQTFMNKSNLIIHFKSTHGETR